MSKHILLNCRCYLAGYDMSGDLNKMEVRAKPNVVPLPLFGPSRSKRKVVGLPDISISHAGAWEATDDAETGGVDKVVFDSVGAVDAPMTIIPLTGAVGEVAYIMKATTGQYQFGGKHGELAEFELTAEGTGLVRGMVLLNGDLTVTGSGTAVEVGPALETQRLYAALHVFSMSGTNPTLSVAIQSAPAQGFASPVERAAFTQVAAPGGWWLTPVDGPVEDRWWRVDYTVGGTNPSVVAALVLGIQA